MARRDNGQGFGFVYFDLSVLLGKNRAFATAQESVETGNYSVPNINFPKFHNGSSKTEVLENTPPSPTGTKKVRDIRDKLDRLQALHHKLHVMLEEVDKLTKKKK